ncbi:MAG: hypothetical protein IJC94_08740 [Oscillospiraceae bacterium]|nr:hypothetical protein [Oscillospiraceae bacterium]
MSIFLKYNYITESEDCNRKMKIKKKNQKMCGENHRIQAKQREFDLKQTNLKVDDHGVQNLEKQIKHEKNRATAS